MSSVKAGSSLKGGYSSSQDAQEEQCTVMLHYWPRVESLRGCSAALDSDKLLGENMCSAEAQDLIKIMGMEAQQFPMRCGVVVGEERVGYLNCICLPGGVYCSEIAASAVAGRGCWFVIRHLVSPVCRHEGAASQPVELAS